MALQHGPDSVFANVRNVLQSHEGIAAVGAVRPGAWKNQFPAGKSSRSLTSSATSFRFFLPFAAFAVGQEGEKDHELDGTNPD